MPKFKLYICLTDYGEGDIKKEIKEKPINQQLQDTLSDGTARQYFLENFFPTVGGINDYDDPQNKYGEEETSRKTKRLQNERRKQKENFDLYDGEIPL